MKKIILLFCLQVIYLSAIQPMAQVAINTNGAPPHPNAALDITGVNKGLLIPRGNAATRTALNANTAKGLMMYDITTNTVWYHNGNGLATGWQSLSTGANYWVPNGATGTEIQNINSGGFWSANPTIVSSDPGTITPPVNGGGTRLMWMPQKSAFRVGTVNGNSWDAANIGLYSFASGYNSFASGASSTAMGQSTGASGNYSFAVGSGNTATGENSTALGAITNAGGASSIAMGNKTNASGIASAAMGEATSASGAASIAIGNGGTATGNSSIVMGVNTNARSFASVAIGRFNDGIAGSYLTNWVSTDPLLIVGNGATDAARHNAMVVYKNGNMVLKNPTTVDQYSGTYSVPVSGAGTRLMWLPEQSAFRVGTVTSEWDAANIGTFSFAAGNRTRASGANSTAIGSSTTASGAIATAMGMGTFATGLNSTAMGRSSTASGDFSTAIGFIANAVGNYSFSIGNNTYARGGNSTAIGENTNANGNSSTAMGSSTSANGLSSTAMGRFTTAAGEASTAIGAGTNAAGVASTAIGYATDANSFASVAIGQFNEILGIDPSNWIPTDPLLILGNGSPTTRSNALVVYKNGNTEINGNTKTNSLQISNGTRFTNMQGGSFLIGSSATALKQVPFSFPVSFSSVPKIVCTVVNDDPNQSNVNDTWVVSVRNISATGFTVNVVRVDFNSGWSTQAKLNWIAFTD